MITPHQLHILRHTIGLDDNGNGREYRNHYCTSRHDNDGKECLKLVAAGLMEDHGDVRMWGGNAGFTVTDAGKELVRSLRPKPVRVSRSRKRWLQWLEVSDAYGSMTFGEWLKRGLYRYGQR